jgi:hypothetical protein
MAFRIKTAACLTFATLVSAADLSYPVRHEHLRKGGQGVLTFSDTTIAFEEAGKQAVHSRKWAFDEIQELELSPVQIRIRTYDDVPWQLGRDHEVRFDHLPKELSAEVYQRLARQMDQRLIARVAVPVAGSLWSMPAKMLDGRAGSNGTLTVGADRIVFESAIKSRTWRYSDVDDITSENSFELTLTSSDGDTRIQLKQRLSTVRYDDLWRRLSQSNGLKSFHSSLETHHD